MKKVVFFFFSWLFSQGIGAQPLDSLLKIVEKENLSLLSRSALLSASKERVTQEGVLENPTLSFSAGRNMLLMGGRQMLPWWGTLNAMKEVARAETFIVQSEYNMLKNELLYEVKKSYFELAKLFQDILRIQSNIALLKKLETVVVEQYRTGKTSMADLIRLQMQIKEEETSIATMQAMKTPLTYRLNQLLNRPLDAPLTIDTSFFLTAEVPIEVEKNPILQAKEADKKVLVAQQKLARYERKPQWMIGLDYGYVDLSMWLSDHASSADMRFLMPMLGISLPIYSKKKNDAKLKELTWKIDALEKETQQIKQQLTVELANADWKKQDAKRKIELYDFQWQQTEKLIALALVEYATGKQSFSDVWQLYLMQNNYQLQKINAIFDYRMATVELEKIHGGH